MIAHRLGLSVPFQRQLADRCPFCKKSCDRRGNHLALCSKEPISQLRHSRVIQDFTRSLPRGSNIELEIHGDTPDTSSRRPLDFSFDMQDGSGRIAGVDISIFDPTIRGETDFLHGRIIKGLHSREKNKITALGGAVNPASVHYVPMIATHFGGLGPATSEGTCTWMGRR